MATPDRPDEFALIARYFAPLAAANPGALGLADDAGIVVPTPGHDVVVTTDTLVAGVHFRADDPADAIGRKLLRVNLSDLAAMGARPMFYTVALGLPASVDTAWIESFVAGLAGDQRDYSVALLGGDTTATPGPLTLTLTAIGEVPSGGALRRSGARDGDEVYVSGTIGDAALGLLAGQGALSGLGPETVAALADRYLLPLPRVALGTAIRTAASAAADVSDGLVADLGHICAASGVAATIDADRVPLSPAAQAVLRADDAHMATVLTGGDDYELVFTAAPRDAAAIAEAAASCGVPVTAIGRTGAGAGISVVDASGAELPIASPGYRHF